MIFFDKYLIKNNKIIVFMLFTLLLCGCKTEDNIKKPEQKGAKVYVSASMAEVIVSRDYQESGDVESGLYYLSYPQETTQIYSLGTVDFDRSITKGIGIVLLPDNEEMTWDKVGGSIPMFYMDNVATTDGNNTSSDPMIVNFDNGSRFSAGLFNNDEENKDLLWSSLMAQNGSLTLNFQLHHNMARLNVEITVDKTYEIAGDLDLTGAKVEITSINQNPVSYDRYTGLLELSTDPEAYSPLELVNEDIDWLSTNTEEGSPVTVYTTQDFVLPPQDLLTDENRPRLIITLSNGRVFSGIVPYAMNVTDQDHPDPYPMTLSFLKEHILTLRTLVSNQPPELTFMPVKVVEWVDKGTFDLDAHQAGIYTELEFMDLIEYYQNNNEFQLLRYGNLVTVENNDNNNGDSGDEENDDDNLIWQFNIWAPLTLKYSSISAQMPAVDDKKDYTFVYNNYTVLVENDEGVTKSVSASQLIQILKGTLTFDAIPN